ncbi:MAG: methyltransferase domain-containing protein [Pseudonocardiales bacterium]|nr:methyltransferase domain-containing protein [Pseudonocardiales bacterium]MBV9652564.1 methyltransferase domain-containing protein [Pseudonocardiales bacterium]
MAVPNTAEPSEAAEQRPASSLTDAIVGYYDQTWLDYRLLWLNPDNLAVHFGYADENTRSHTDALKNMNRVLADRVQVKAGDRILDAGCGVGGSALWLAKERRAEVVGITLAARQVQKARSYAARRNLTHRVHFEVADFTATPFPDASFDVVWAVESLCHAADKAAFYQEAARVLRPGGRVVVADFVRSGRPLDPTGERLLHEWLTGWAVPDIDTPSEHTEHLAAAGFVDARLDDVTAHTRPSLRRLYRMAYWTYPLALYGYVKGVRSAVQHGNVIASIRQYQALRHGAWFYSILSATRPAIPDM